jgi:hypothetical protein
MDIEKLYADTQKKYPEIPIDKFSFMTGLLEDQKLVIETIDDLNGKIRKFNENDV